MSPELTQRILELRCPDQDVARMHELAAKNQEGTITLTEREELDADVIVGDLLAILHSKARKTGKPAPPIHDG
jgi:hypothetical protein